MRPLNDVGPSVARLRYQLGLTQDQVAARAQCAGFKLTRQTLANIESRRCRVTDRQIMILARILGCQFIDLFPKGSRSRSNQARQSKTSDLLAP